MLKATSSVKQKNTSTSLFLLTFSGLEACNHLNCFKAHFCAYSTQRSVFFWFSLSLHPTLLICFITSGERQCTKSGFAFFFPLYRLPASNTVKQLPGTTDNKTSGLEFVCRSFCGTESCECCCQGSCLCKRGLGRKKIGKLMFSIMCLSIWTISIDCVNIYFILRTCWSCC